MTGGPVKPASARNTTSGSSTSSSASKFPVPGRGQERVDDLPLLTERRRIRRVRTPNAPARAGGELARRAGVAIDDRTDLVERDAEHVVQNEREPLGGRERIEDDHQRHPDAVGEQRLVLGIVLAFPEQGDGRLSRPLVDEILAPRLAGPQHVEADAADHRRQPRAHVLDPGRVRAAEPEPCLLHSVVRLGS